jgi:uncharacterized protein (DUF302 family)
MLVKLSTHKTVSEAAAALHAAVQANHFGVMQVHNLKETMAKKGVEFARECLIVEQTLSVVTTSASKSKPITKQN